MSLPTPDNLKTMDWDFQAQSFVDVPSKDSIDIKTMDYTYLAQPFVRNYGVAAPSTLVKDLIQEGIMAFPR